MRVLIVGAGKGGSALLKILDATKRMHIIAVIDQNMQAKGLQLAREMKIPIGDNWRNWIHKDIDIVIETTGLKKVLHDLLDEKKRDTIVVPGSLAYIISELFEDKALLLKDIQTQMDQQALILNNIHDGMIVVDEKGIIQFVNKSSEEIVGFSKNNVEGKPIQEVIPNTKLPDAIRKQRKEVNQTLLLESGKQVITTRIPMIDHTEKMIGSFALFKDITEVMTLAEENTDLKSLKTMLEAIILSSEEAISVVDENGRGLMINPAYTKLTGLRKEEVIGKPAATDIYEGESMHMKVLKTRRPVRGVPMHVGEGKKEVMVNVAPIIVDNQIKGSVGVLHDVSEIHELTTELKRARQTIRSLEAKYTFADIRGTSTAMQAAIKQAKMGAHTPATVLLRGKSGTGKELIAHAIHNESDRKHRHFVRVNCVAISESLLESELFGYEEGSFSGAKHGGKIGYFEEAHMGSLFLDEIGEISLEMQTKLLRVLQDGEIIRVGGTKPIQLNVRIIAATNKDLEHSLVDKTFREDLYYRLNRLPIYVPALQERLTDLPQLVQHIIQKTNVEYGREVQSISTEAIQILQQHDWPGNIRELENIIGRAMIYMKPSEQIITSENFPELKAVETVVETLPIGRDKTVLPLKRAVESYEKKYISKVYKENNYHKTKTAKELNISIRNLYYKLERYKLE